MKFIMLNSTLFACGSIHQGDNRFSDITRGKQCAFMNFSALLCDKSYDILTWRTETIDGILIKGDAMDLKAFDERSIPDEETISYLPDRILSSTIVTAMNQTITKLLNCVNILIRQIH